MLSATTDGRVYRCGFVINATPTDYDREQNYFDTIQLLGYQLKGSQWIQPDACIVIKIHPPFGAYS